MASPRENAWWKQPGISPLVAEFVTVRSCRGPVPTSLIPNKVPLLKQRARECFPLASTDVAAIQSLLQATVEQLPAEFREPARYEVGIKHAGLHGEEQNSRTRRTAAANEMGFSLSALRHNELRERQLLELLANLVERFTTTEPVSDPDAFQTPYVRREQLHDNLTDAVRALKGPEAAGFKRRGMVVVQGEHGSGASRLVYEHFRNKDMVRLTAESDDALTAAAWAELERRGKSLGSDSAAARFNFAKLLSSTDGAHVYVFDNAPSVESVLAWLPDHLRVTVVVVTHAIATARLAPAVLVGSIHDDGELTQVVRQLSNDDLNEDEALMLGLAVGRRIGAVDAALRLRRQLGSPPMSAMVDLLTRNVLNLDAAYEPGERSLLRIYVEAIRVVVEDASANALELLMTMAWGLRERMTPRSLMALTLVDAAYAGDPDVQVVFLKAMRSLLELGLVRRDHGRFSMDPLVASIVRRATHTGVPGVAEQVLASQVRREGNDGPANGSEPTWTPVELLRLGWTPEDVAAFVTSNALMMARIDPKALTASYDGPAVRDIGARADDIAGRVWSLTYLVAKDMADGSRLGRLMAATAALAPPRTLSHLVSRWTHAPECADQLEDVFGKELAALAVPIQDDEVRAWIDKYDLGKPRSAKEREVMRNAYRGFRWGMTGREFAAQIDSVPDELARLTEVVDTVPSELRETFTRPFDEAEFARLSVRLATTLGNNP